MGLGLLLLGWEIRVSRIVQVANNFFPIRRWGCGIRAAKAGPSSSTVHGSELS